MKDYYAYDDIEIKIDEAKRLFDHINKNYSTLPFCKRWLREDGFNNYEKYLKYLFDNNIVTNRPSLSDVLESHVAQYEQTLLLRSTCKEVISRCEYN